MHRWAFIGTGDISRRLASDLSGRRPGGSRRSGENGPARS